MNISISCIYITIYCLIKVFILIYEKCGMLKHGVLSTRLKNRVHLRSWHHECVLDATEAHALSSFPTALESLTRAAVL